jgi:hypothetical protein
MAKLFALILLSVIMKPVTASILPSNNLAIPVSEKNEGLSESQYHAVIDKVENVYRPIIEKLGRKLSVKRLWDSPTVNAGTIRNGKEIIIKLYGGYARHSLVSEDGYALVICHELGHHLGGAPRKIYDSGTVAWPSTEGQADYFATLKCLRKVFQKDDNEAVIKGAQVPEIISEKCKASFPTDWEKALCIRTTLAGISVGNISADIRRTEKPKVETPDPSIVETTFEAHPEPQCRLDTYFQGSICEVSSIRSISETNELTGTCHPKSGHTEGTRPLCWYRPAE